MFGTIIVSMTGIMLPVVIGACFTPREHRRPLVNLPHFQRNGLILLQHSRLNAGWLGASPHPGRGKRADAGRCLTSVRATQAGASTSFLVALANAGRSKFGIPLG